MKNAQIDPKALYWASFNCFEFRMPGEAVIDCSRSGANDEAVAHWMPKVMALIESDNFKNKPTEEKIARELKEYGAWSAEELQDVNQNWQRIVWNAAHNISEEESPDCTAPMLD